MWKTSDCWEWKGVIGSHGYAIIGRTLVHRAMYEGFRGPIPENLTIDHLCRNTKCVNPFHMEAVTMTENIMRGKCPSALNAKKTHCKRGHLLDEVNCYVIKREGKLAGRNCKKCRATAERERQKRRRLSARANKI